MERAKLKAKVAAGVLTEWQQIGKGNAETAIDQAGDDLHDSIESYYANAGDTLAERGVKDGDHQAIGEMDRAFADVLAKHGITYRPHGINA